MEYPQRIKKLLQPFGISKSPKQIPRRILYHPFKVNFTYKSPDLNQSYTKFTSNSPQHTYIQPIYNHSINSRTQSEQPKIILSQQRKTISYNNIENSNEKRGMLNLSTTSSNIQELLMKNQQFLSKFIQQKINNRLSKGNYEQIVNKNKLMNGDRNTIQQSTLDVNTNQIVYKEVGIQVDKKQLKKGEKIKSSNNLQKFTPKAKQKRNISLFTKTNTMNSVKSSKKQSKENKTHSIIIQNTQFKLKPTLKKRKK